MREHLAAKKDRSYQLLVPDAATDDQILLAHEPEYLRRVITGDLNDTDVRRIGFPWSPELVTRSRYSTGATICAALVAMDEGVAANLAGGTHHAFADTAAGYCVLTTRLLLFEYCNGEVKLLEHRRRL